MTDSKLISGVAHLGIRVRDLDRSRTFYEKLGFEFVVGPVGPEPVAIMKHPSGVEINFILNASEPEDENVLMDVERKYAGYTHAALRSDDLDAMMTHLSEQGIELSGGPDEFGAGARSIFIRDPDRNVIEFHQPGSGA